MRLEFDKMQGAGNDFILIDNRDGKVPDQAKRDLVVKYCHRRLGIGADGMIFVQNDPEFDFAWDFYNSDGSIAEMCGNGARCVARYANKIGAAGETMVFRSIAGPIRAQLTNRGSKVQLTNVQLPSAPLNVPVDDKTLDIWFLNTGVPHAVIQVDDLDKLEVKKLGAAIRNHQQFAPSGTNVNFISLHDGDKLSIRTYERGVEDETLACGTGSVASSIIAGCYLGKSSPVTAVTRSGEELVIHFSRQGGQIVDVFLEGGATLVFSGSFEV